MSRPITISPRSIGSLASSLLFVVALASLGLERDALAAMMPCCQDVEVEREACHYLCDQECLGGSGCLEFCHNDCDNTANNTNCIGPGGGCDTYEPPTLYEVISSWCDGYLHPQYGYSMYTCVYNR